MITKDNYIKWIVGAITVIVIIGIIIFVRNQMNKPDSGNGNSGGSGSGTGGGTGSTTTAQSVYAGSTASLISPIPLYSSIYPFVTFSNVYAPNILIGTVVDLQGASNYAKIKDLAGNNLIVEKSRVKFV